MRDPSRKRLKKTPRERGFLFEPELALEIGQLYREHGVKGFCKVHVYSQSDENLVKGRAYWLVAGEKILSVHLSELSHVGRYFLLRFAELSGPEDLIPWRKAGLWMSQSDLTREGDALYDFEWQGFELLQKDGQSLGQVVEIVYTPLRNFLLKKPDGGELNIPFEKSWISKIDSRKKQLTMDLPEGIADL